MLDESITEQLYLRLHTVLAWRYVHQINQFITFNLSLLQCQGMDELQTIILPEGNMDDLKFNSQWSLLHIKSSVHRLPVSAVQLFFKVRILILGGPLQNSRNSLGCISNFVFQIPPQNSSQSLKTICFNRFGTTTPLLWYQFSTIVTLVPLTKYLSFTQMRKHLSGFQFEMILVIMVGKMGEGKRSITKDSEGSTSHPCAQSTDQCYHIHCRSLLLS